MKKEGLSILEVRIIAQKQGQNVLSPCNNCDLSPIEVLARDDTGKVARDADRKVIVERRECGNIIPEPEGAICNKFRQVIFVDES